MSEKSVKGKSVCFTGHRSQKLPWGFNEKDERCIKMKENLQKEIVRAIERGYDTFYCGMAIGFDMICAETVLGLKDAYPQIKIIAALPCRTQELRWRNADKVRYRNLLKKVDGVRCIYDTYIGAECMRERNRFMVDNSSLLIALFDGMYGGTKSTVEYAKKQGLEIVIIES